MPICARSTWRDGVVVAAHRERDAEVADHGRHHVAGPPAVGAAVGGAALQADAGRVDRFLAERAEALALKGLHAPAHLAAHEELLQPVVDGAGEAHAAQDLLALVARERRGERLALQPAVTGLGDLRPRLFEAADGRHTRRRLVEGLAARYVAVEPAGEFAAEHRPQRLEPGLVTRLQLGAAAGLEHLEHETNERRLLLGDEGAQS